MRAIPPAIAALAADGPHPDLAAELRLFGQFVGSWDLDVTWHEDGCAVRSATGEWHFAWALEGRAVMDVWIVPPRSLRRRGVDLYEYGCTMRFYDPALDAWRSTWVGPMHGVVVPFVARASGQDIVLEGGQTTDGRAMRWSFSEIGAQAFAWRNEVSDDGGLNWVLQQDFRCRRVAS